ncbi:hypothetical protein [uncultured Sphingomonas sp.]|uniref:hypothetical protein n=1 Tax=uncultured Sphingomonas sp. TaxID=158754 RepID=UPI0025D64B43|nr:hypothetical protein [uncultured Sphingomonas sp.]
MSSSPTNPSIDWSMEVELFEPDKPPSLRILRTKMTLRDAVETILAMPRERWTRSGIGLHAPIYMELEGRPVLQGYLSGHAARQMAGEFEFPSA